MGFLDKPVGDMTEDDLVRLIKQVINREVPPIPAILSTFDDGDAPLIPPPAPAQDQALTWDDATGTFVYNDIDSSFVGSDGGTPSTLTVTLEEGPGWIQAKWNVPTGTDDALYYKVFLRPTVDPTTADATYLLDITPATSYVISNDVGGTPLTAGTTYHVIVVAFSAASGNESAASVAATGQIGDVDGSVLTISNINASAITTGSLDAARIAAGSIDASKLNVTELSAITADMGQLTAGHAMFGTEESTRVEVGETEHMDTTMTGIHAFDIDNEITFMLDAADGSVFVKGRIQFGSSFLTVDNFIELYEQSSSGFQTPVRVQSASSGGITGSSASVNWPSPTTVGNLLVMSLYINDPDGTVPTPTTPAGWTLAESQVAADSNNALYVYYWKNAPVKSGAQAITLGDTAMRWIVTVYEYSGADDLDATTDVENIAQTTHNADAVTSTQDAVFMSVCAFYKEATSASFDVDGPTSDITDFRNNSIVETVGANDFRATVFSGDFMQSGADTVDTVYTTDSITSPGTPVSADSIIIMLAFQAKVASLAGIASTADTARLFSYPVASSTETYPYAVSSAGHASQLGGPTGAVTAFAAASAPDGWLLCDGTSYLRADYPGLYAVIGTTYGAADGTHFNVPDMRNRVPVAKGTDTEFDTLGETGGASTITLAESQIPSHTHGPINANFDAFMLRRTSGGGSLTAGAGSAWGTGATTDATGGGGSHSNIQKYITLNFIIKV